MKVLTVIAHPNPRSFCRAVLERFTAGLISIAALLLCAGCIQEVHAAALDEEEAVPVKLVAVERGPFQRPILAPGVLAAKNEWDLSFKVGGVVSRVLVEEGALVRKGDLLAMLDATEYSAGLRQAREGLSKARRDASRGVLLASSGAVSPAVVEDGRTAAMMAEAALTGAEFNMRHSRLVAPEDAWVDRRMVEPGEVVGPGRPVLHVSGRGQGFVVRASISERDVLDLIVGAPARVAIDARTGLSLAGRVSEVARSAARGTGTYPIEITLTDTAPGVSLLAGLTAKVEIPRSVAAAGAVPIAAVVDGNGDAGAVFTVDGGLARRVPVRIAFIRGADVVLDAGVEQIGRVVTDGVTRLRDGLRVRVLE
jgi:membrane fusion protein, multidrug efflux system